MPVSIRIPKVLIDTLYPNTDFNALSDVDIKHVKKSAKQLIERAIIESLEPASVRLETESDFVGHLTINILNKYNRAVIKHSRQSKSPEAVTALGYLMAALNHDWHMGMIEEQETALTPYLNRLGYKSRSEQHTFYRFVDDALGRQRIGIVETSTGVGKTLGILAQANERALNEGKLSLIATNSLANIQQYIEDYSSLVDKKHVMAPLHLIVGRQNFVSSERLIKWLESDACKIDERKVRDWLESGGRHDDESEFLPQMTIDSLKAIEPGIVESEVSLSLSASESDAGYDAYKSQFSEAMEAKSAIIIVTHTMLCIDAKMRRLRSGMSDEVLNDLAEMRKEISQRFEQYQKAADGEEKAKALAHYNELSEAHMEYRMAATAETGRSLLPNYHYLFVDEAHLLEAAMTNATSETISLRSIIRDVKAQTDTGSYPVSRIKEATKLIDELITQSAHTKQDQLMLSGKSERENSLLLRFCDSLLGARTKKLEGSINWLSQVRQLKVGLSRINKSNFTCVLSYSPIRQYPQINTGEINTKYYFKDMWARVEGAVVISATLYIKRYNAHSSNYVSSLLAISEKRRAEYPPVIANWTRDVVKMVYLPPAEREHSDKLLPVGRAFKGTLNDRAKTKEAWEWAVANYIEHIYQNAAGGTMVLLTAYEDCLNISNFVKTLSANIPLVIATGDTTLDEQKARFIALTKEGVKPLWLAVGNAWVGLDINGKSIGLDQNEISTKDSVITDLVIVKIPFGTNASLSHMVRMMKMQNRSSDLELMETIMRLKQGFGRLVRLENQPRNRQIHLLDGRLNHPKYKGFLSLIKALVDTYPHSNYREALDIE